MRSKKLQHVDSRRYSALLIQVFASLLIMGSMAGDMSHAQGQGLFQRLRERRATPPLPQPQPPVSRVPRYQQPLIPGGQVPGAQVPGAQVPGTQRQAPTPLTQTYRPNASGAQRAPTSAPSAADSLGGSILGRDPSGRGEQVRPTLGIRVKDRTEGTGAVEVLDFKDHSKADEAGLLVGDLIYSVDGRPTPTTAALARELSRRSAGESVQLGVQRGRRVGNLDVPLVALPDDRLQQVARAALPPEPQGGRLGVQIRNAEGSRGAIVTSIEPNSPAQRFGIQVGDRIVSVDGRMVADTPSLIREVDSHAPGAAIALQLVRDDRLYVSRVNLAGPENVTAKTDVPANKSPTADLAEDSGKSILGGVGAAIGGLLKGQPPTDQELPPPPNLSTKPLAAASTEKPAPKAGPSPASKAVASPAPKAVPSPAPKPSAKTLAKPANQSNEDALAFGDEEPINQVIFEAPLADTSEPTGPRLVDDPPSLTAPPKPQAKPDEVAELEAEIKRLQAKIEELKASK